MSDEKMGPKEFSESVFDALDNLVLVMRRVMHEKIPPFDDQELPGISAVQPPSTNSAVATMT